MFVRTQVLDIIREGSWVFFSDLLPYEATFGYNMERKNLFYLFPESVLFLFLVEQEQDRKGG